MVLKRLIVQKIFNQLLKRYMRSLQLTHHPPPPVLLILTMKQAFLVCLFILNSSFDYCISFHSFIYVLFRGQNSENEEGATDGEKEQKSSVSCVSKVKFWLKISSQIFPPANLVISKEGISSWKKQLPTRLQSKQGFL